MNAVIALGSLVLLSFAAGCSSNPGSPSDSNLPSVSPDQISPKRVTLFYEKGSDIPYTGTVVDYYPSGEKKLSAHFKDGLSVGPSLQWYRSGQLSHEEDLDSNRTGRVTEWYENGQLKSERSLLNGGVNGFSTAWHPNGQKRIEENYLVEGRPKDGTSTKWYENGHKKSETRWADGQNRCSVEWDQSGNKGFQFGYGCGCEVASRDARQRMSIEDVSIGVLPFKAGAYTRDGDNGVSLDSVTQAIVRELTDRGAQADVHEADSPCGFDYILEGSVWSTSDEISLSVQLISVSDGSYFWQERYKRILAELPVIQQEIGQQIARALSAQWGE